MTRSGTNRTSLSALLGLVGLLALVSAATWDQAEALRSARSSVERSDAVLSAIRDLDIAVRDAETGQRGYLLTGDGEYLAPYEAALSHIALLQGALQHLTADNPVQQTQLRRLAPILQHKLEELAQTIQLRRTDGLNAALQVVQSDAGRDLMEQVEAVLASMQSEAQSLLTERTKLADHQGEVVRLLGITAAAIALVALIWAVWLLHQAWRRSVRTEARQRSLALSLHTSLDSLSQGVAVFGPRYRLRHWNECFQVLLELPKAMVREGTPYVVFAEHTAEHGSPMLETEEQIRYGRSDQPVIYEAANASGHQLEIRRTAMPDGGFVLTISDMTKRAAAEAVLREAQKMQAIGQLTGGIAHDFNNLLTAVMGNLELIAAKLGTAHALLPRVEGAMWAAQRGATLTAQLLAFARKQSLAPAPINLSKSVSELLPLLHRTLGADVDIRCVETAGLWPAMADAVQLETALLNLALNARDAMPGGGRLTIELANKVLDEEYARNHAEVTVGEYAMVGVSDTGHGMTPDVLARVFEPFFTTKPEGKGTGLGLAMVFGFVKQSGGHISIYSEPGEGTTVRVYLPRARETALQRGQRALAPVELPHGSATVLVVEDEHSVREITAAMLRDLGYRVLEAADGEEGLRTFGSHVAEIELLLTDVVLPAPVRGRDLAEQIRAVKPDIKVLFMSGYTENSIVHQGRLEDGVHLLIKPFQREQLARKVAEVLADQAPINPAPQPGPRAA